MGKRLPFSKKIDELLQATTSGEGKDVKMQNLKDVAEQIKSLSIGEISQNVQNESEGFVSNFLQLLIKFFNDDSSDMRSLATQEYDVLIKRFFEKSPSGTLRLIVSHLRKFSNSSRKFHCLLTRITYMLERLDFTSQKQTGMSETILKAISDRLSDQDKTVQDTIEKLFPKIIEKIVVGDNFLKTTFHSSMNLLFTDKSASYRSCAVVASEICTIDSEYVMEGLQLANEYLLNTIRNNETPYLGVYYFYQKIVSKYPYGRLTPELEKTLSLLLISTNLFTPEVVYAVLAALTELMSKLPGRMKQFDPSTLGFCQESDEDQQEDTFVDPLMNSAMYEMNKRPSMALPSFANVVLDGVDNLRKYVAGFLFKKYLLFTFVRSNNGDHQCVSNVRSSLQCVALTTILTIATRESISKIQVKEGDETYKLIDVPKLAFSQDVAVSQRAISLIPLMLKHADVRDRRNLFETVSKIISLNAYNNTFINLLDSFNYQNIDVLINNRMTKNLMEMALYWCREGPNNHRVIVAQFAAAVLTIPEIRAILEDERLEQFQVVYLNLLKTSSKLFRGSNLTDGFIRLFQIDMSSKDKGYAVLRQVLNCNSNTIRMKDGYYTRSRVQKLCEFLYNEQSKDFTNSLNVPVNMCNRLFEFTSHCTDEFEALDYSDLLETNELKKEDVLAILHLTAKLNGRKMAKLVKMKRLPACAEIAEKLFLLGLETSNLFTSASDPYAVSSPSRNGENGFEKKDALNSLFGDLNGAIKNYKMTLQTSSDEKVFEYLDAFNSLLSTGLEFTRLENLDLFYELTEWIAVLFPIKPVAALDLLHQLLKCTFSTNSVSSLEPEVDDFHMTALGSFTAWDTITEMLVNDRLVHSNLINMQKGFMNRGQPDNRAQKAKIDAMLPFIEPLLHEAIKLFSCCSIEGKKRIILIIVELMLNGSEYDQIDGSNIIKKEMYYLWGRYDKKNAAVLLPAIAQFIVVYGKCKKLSNSELDQFKITLMEKNDKLIRTEYKYVTQAMFILCLNSPPSDEAMKEFAPRLRACLTSSPQLALDLLHLILFTEDAEEKDKFENRLLAHFFDWVIEEKKDTVEPIPLLFTISLMTGKKLLKFWAEDAKNELAYAEVTMRNRTIDCLFLVTCFHFELVVENGNRLEKLAMDVFKHLPQDAYPEARCFREVIQAVINEKHFGVPNETIFFVTQELIHNTRAQLNRARLREAETDESDLSDQSQSIHDEDEAEMFVEIDTEDPPLDPVEEQFLESIIADILKPTTQCRGYSISARVLIHQKIEWFWFVVNKIYRHSTMHFWSILISEIRFKLREEKFPLSAHFITLQMLALKSFGDGNGNSNFLIFLKTMAFNKETDLELTVPDTATFNKFLDFCHSKFVQDEGYSEFAADVLIKMYNNYDVQKFIGNHPIETLKASLDLLRAWIPNIHLIEVFERRALSFIYAGLDNINAEVELPLRDDGSRYEIKELLAYCYGVCCVAYSTLKNHPKSILTAAVLRHPIIYEMFMISQEAIEQRWTPVVMVQPNGGINIQLPKVHFLGNKNTLIEIQMKISKVGWLNKAQFDNLCVSLLGVLSSTPTGPELSMKPVEEVEEIIESSDMAVQMWTSILLMSVKFPSQGSPMSSYVTKYREQLDPFFSTPEFTQFSALKSLYRGCGKSAVAANIERFNEKGWNSLTTKFGPNQLPVVSLLTLCGLLGNDAKTPAIEKGIMPSISQFLFDTASDLDTVSNVRSLLHCFTHWLSQGVDLLPRVLLNSVVKSLAYLSDFFDDVSTYQFLLVQSRIIFEGQYIKGMSEEGLVVYCILKSMSVIGIENFQDMQKQIIIYIDRGLNNDGNSLIYTLAGLLYLLESADLSTMPQVADYVTRYLFDNLASFFSKHALRPANSSRFALSATIRILLDPFSTKYKPALFEQVFQAFSTSESRIDVDILAEGIELLLCSSIEAVDRYYDLIREVFGRKDLIIRPSSVACWIRVLSVITFRYAASNDETHHTKLRAVPNMIFKVLESWKNDDFDWVCRTVPKLIEKSVGFEASFKYLVPTRFRVSNSLPLQRKNMLDLWKEYMVQIAECPELSLKWARIKPLICQNIAQTEHSEEVKTTLLSYCEIKPFY